MGAKRREKRIRGMCKRMHVNEEETPKSQEFKGKFHSVFSMFSFILAIFLSLIALLHFYRSSSSKWKKKNTYTHTWKLWETVTHLQYIKNKVLFFYLRVEKGR